MSVQPEKNLRAWQRMLSGRRLDLLNPSPFDVEIEDIAHGLARVARWNGQTVGEHAFSVAQHSVLVTEMTRLLKPQLSAEEELLTLLHDAPEYVIGDMISPFKNAMGADYKGVEDRLAAAIHMRFTLPPAPTSSLKKLIKKADKAAAFYEATLLAGFDEMEARQFFGLVPPEIAANDDWRELVDPLPTKEAQGLFTSRFHAIMKGRGV